MDILARLHENGLLGISSHDSIYFTHFAQGNALAVFGSQCKSETPGEHSWSFLVAGQSLADAWSLCICIWGDFWG